MSMRAALALAEKGFYVFPLLPNSKLPAIEDFSNQATRDPQKIKMFWTDPVLDIEQGLNVGIATSKFYDAATKNVVGLIVIDVDNKNNKKGFQSLTDLTKSAEMPITYIQATPTGGVHIVFKSDKPVRQGVNVLGPGLDIRSYGGYIVGAGSSIDGKDYTVMHDCPVVDSPIWLINNLGNISVNVKDLKRIDNVLTIPTALNRAIDYLRNDAKIAVEGAGGDQETFKVAAQLRDYGLNERDTLSLMAEYWNERCFPPWSMDALEDKVINAFKYGRNKPGSLAPETEFGPVAKRETSFSYSLFNVIDDTLKKKTLIKNLLDQECLSVMYGDSNSGKTFIAMDMAIRIAANMQCHGHDVTPGGVLYIAAEGGNSIRKRVVGFRKHHKLDGQDIPFGLVASPIDLRNPNADLKLIIDLINQFQLETRVKTVMVVIDTLSRALSGGDENSSEDMGAFVKSVDQIKTQCKTHVMVIHHSGKDQSRGARGHSLLRAAADTEIEIIAGGEMIIKKQRDMDIIKAKGFALSQVVIGKDSDGDLVVTCVVESKSIDQGAKSIKGAPRDLLTILEKTFNSTASTEDLRLEYYSSLAADIKDSTKKRSFYRALKILKEASRVIIKGEIVSIPGELAELV